MDVFRFQGLGKTGAQMWQLLADGQARGSREIATVTGRDLRTVDRKLGQMYALEMIEPDIAPDGLVWKAVQVDLDQIADKSGTHGAGEAQRKAHRTERNEHRLQLEKGVKK